MIVNIVCGAPHPLEEKVDYVSEQMVNISVDRGALYLLQQNLPMAHAVGDFDSLTAAEFETLKAHHIHITKLSLMKNETDTEVALEMALSFNPTEIRFIYALGGRLDHSFANIKLLMRLAKQQIRATILNESNSMQVLSPGSYEFTHFKHPYVSFFAYDQPVKNLTLKGFKYPLTGYTLEEDDIRCISNEVDEKTCNVSFESGLLFMVNSSD